MTKELSLDQFTLKELRAKAIELGMPQEVMDGFKSKAPLIATINTLRAKDANNKVKRVETLNPPESPKEKRAIEKRWKSKAMVMRDKLDKQEKVRILLPLEGKEKPGVLRKVKIKGREEYVHVGGAIETVTLNGYKTIIPKGVYFYVPKQVSDVLAESYRQTQSAGSEFLLDRIDDKTGKPVRELM